MRLIDADHAKHTYIQDMFDTEGDFERVNDVLDYAPTVDAVVVTRCKDCANSYEDAFGRVCTYGICVDCTVPDDFFCASSKPKEEPHADDHD